MINDRIYVFDPTSQTIYRSVGWTNRHEFIVYPKYIKSPLLWRKRKNRFYRGVAYPNGSIKYLKASPPHPGQLVSIKLNEYFGVFTPVAEKNSHLETLYPQKQLVSRLKKTTRTKTVKDCKLLLDKLVKLGANINNIGLDGSLLAETENENSDIDLVAYGQEEFLKIKKIIEENSRKLEITLPEDDPDFFIRRRKAYSPLMTYREIILWETRKISGKFKDRKFSIMPTNPKQLFSKKLHPLNLNFAIRVLMLRDDVIYDPGYLDLTTIVTETVYGLQNLKIAGYLTFLPSRMGVHLKKGDTILITGKLYRHISDKQEFYLCQFPWDDDLREDKTFFVAKVELTKSDNKISRLFGEEFEKRDFTE